MTATTQGATVPRNYAEALLALARKAEDPVGWGTMLRQLANAIDSDATLQRFLDSPRIPNEARIKILTTALGDRVPRLFLRFVQTLVQNRRQALIPQIATEYEQLVDEAENVVHARVTVAKEMSEQEERTLASGLSSSIGKRVIPHITTDPSILGGVIVRMGDTVMDGSVRRRLQTLRRQMTR